jgi:hypothetical protein
MTGESKASAPPFKGRNRGSPLENPHRAKKIFENCKNEYQYNFLINF